MPVNKDPSGRRSVQAEVEVPGTPEQVWQAIATGPGISSWFVPAESEDRVGGKMICHFGPGNSMDSVATITALEPPHRLTADSQDMGPESPVVATEWTVEARAGGTCVVRVVHSWFASNDDWDAQFEQFENGWPAFFRILKQYLAHFPGQPATAFQLMGSAPEPAGAAWAALTTPLGLAGATVGQRVQSPPGVPQLAGEVVDAGPPQFPSLLLRLDAPAPGLAHLFAMPMGGQVILPLRLYLYGDRAAATATRVEPEWQAWIAKTFAAPAGAGGPAC